MSLPFLPSHVFCEQAHAFFSLTRTPTLEDHTQPTHKVMFRSWNWLSFFGDSCQHSPKGPSFRSSPHLFPPVDRTSHHCQSQKECLPPFFFLLPVVSVPVKPPPPSLEINTMPSAAHSPVLVFIRFARHWEGIQRSPWWKKLSPPSVSYFFLPYKGGDLWITKGKYPSRTRREANAFFCIGKDNLCRKCFSSSGWLKW